MDATCEGSRQSAISQSLIALINIPIYIRIKEDTQVLSKNGQYTIALRDVFEKVKPCGKKVLKGSYRVLGVDVNLAASRNPDGELLIVLTNRCPYKALKKYKRRWSIETLFGYFKTKGFNFEDTHMTVPDKVAAWMLLLTIAVAWVMKTSLVFKEKSWLAAHGRPRKSVFRNGFDKLRRSLLHPLEEGLQELCRYIYLLRDPKCPLNMV